MQKKQQNKTKIVIYRKHFQLIVINILLHAVVDIENQWMFKEWTILMLFTYIKR